jgi:hypothetical protein
VPGGADVRHHGDDFDIAVAPCSPGTAPVMSRDRYEIDWEGSGFLSLMNDAGRRVSRDAAVLRFHFLLKLPEGEPQPYPGDETEPIAGLLNRANADFCLRCSAIDADFVHRLT